MSELDLLKRKLEREKAARKQAEQILEAKALELYTANESLRKLNENLEEQIQVRTKDLQESELKYRNVIENATDIIYSTDEEGFFTFINPIGSDAFGFSLEEIIGKRYIDFVLDEHKEQLFEYYTKFRDEGITTDYFEFPIRSKDNKVHWIGQNVNRVESANGSYYYNAVARDITLRKNAEQELERAQNALTQSEVKYRSVLENLELGLMEVDTEGKIRRVYDHFCKMTGYTSDELLGKDAISTLLLEKYQELVKKQDEKRINRQTGVYEVQVRRKDGKLIWVLISGAPFYNSSGDIIGSLGIHFDITERKELESNLKIARHKAIQAQKAEQQFLANMSHEIRTPLNAIIGMSHLLKDTSLDNKQEEFVDILSDSAALLKGLVSDILDISKIDSGMAEKNESAFNMSIFARRLIKTFEIRANDKGIKLTSNFQFKEGCIVHSDMQWLNQIFINLLSNGIKFTPKGEVKLVIKEVKSSETYSQFYFEIYDTGIGMEQRELENIFTSFKQANTNVRTEFGGTGLGLSIASRLVSLLGGDLEVESEKDRGSRFYFSLNLKTASEEDIAKNTFEEYNMSSDHKIKLLVVEDNLMNQKYISALLNKWKIPFDLAENGQQAVDKFNQQHYDLIFMDLSMPVMDGYEATNIIRSTPGNEVPIIALTASTFLSKKELAMQAGMTDFLAKPFTPEELSIILKKHLPIRTSSSDSNSDGSSLPSIDRVGLAKLYNNDQVHALDMFMTYKEIIGAELKILKTAIHTNEHEQIRKQVHKIKPMFSMVGLKEITKTCEVLQESIIDSNITDIKELATKIITQADTSHGLIVSEIEQLEKNLKHIK